MSPPATPGCRRAVEKGLSRRLHPLLLGRACRDDSQARGRHRAQDEQGCRRDDGLLLRRANRGRSPAPVRHRPAQDRTSRRHGMPIVNPLIFYPVRAVEFVSVVAKWLTVGWRYHSIKKRVLADPAHKDYVDDATRPVTLEDVDHDESWRPSPTRSRTPTAPEEAARVASWKRTSQARAVHRSAGIMPKIPEYRPGGLRPTFYAPTSIARAPRG